MYTRRTGHLSEHRDLSLLAQEIFQLYLDDLKVILENVYAKPPIENRSSSWQEVAMRYPAYEAKIVELHAVLKKAYVTRYSSSLLLNAEMDSHFSDITDGDAAAFLVDILYVRILDSEGILHERDCMTIEEKMKQELGIGVKRSAAEITLADIIEAVLKNQLKLPRF